MALKALIISEDKKIADSIIGMTKRKDFEFIYCPTFLEGLNHLVSEEIALTIIQLASPWESSIHKLYPLRWVSDTFLVVMLYPGNIEDKAHFLDMADECMWLPVDAMKMATIEKQATNRRLSPLTSHSKREYFYNRGLLFFPVQFRLFFAEHELHPSRLDYDLLYYLIRHRDSIVSREQLLDDVWHVDYSSINDTTVSSHIYTIREMLREHSDEVFIETVRGFGYKFVTENTERCRKCGMNEKRKMAS